MERCETLCDAGCCGLEAFDLSPIHTASFLIRYGQVSLGELEALHAQVDALAAEAARLTAEGGQTIIRGMMPISAEAFATLSATLRSGMARALRLIEDEERGGQPAG